MRMHSGLGGSIEVLGAPLPSLIVTMPGRRKSPQRRNPTEVPEHLAHASLVNPPLEKLSRTTSRAAKDEPVSNRPSLCDKVPPALLSTPLGRLPELPVALRYTTTPDQTLGELIAQQETLHHGRTTAGLRRWLRGVRAEAKGADATAVAEGRTLLKVFTARLPELDEKELDVLSRRLGLDCPVETREEIRVSYEVTRERVRQIEESAFRQLLQRGWGSAVRKRIARSYKDGVVSFRELARQPWYAGVDKEPGERILAALVEHLFHDAGVVALPFNGAMSLMPAGMATLDEMYEQVRVEIAALTFPMPAEELEEAVRRRAPSPSVAPSLVERTCADILWELDRRGRRTRALGFGDSQANALSAILRASPVPLSRRELERKLGRVPDLPPDVFYIDDTMLAVERHFPGFEALRERLAPACLEVVAQAPARQWSTSELLAELTARGTDLPDGFNDWRLVALLRRSPEFRYLGRGRFVLAESTVTRRLHHADAVRLVLESKSSPMPFRELLAAVKELTDITYNRLHDILARDEYVQGAGGWSVRSANPKAGRKRRAR
jgi:hypothetical protein